jgi:hypothetical protein
VLGETEGSTQYRAEKHDVFLNERGEATQGLSLTRKPVVAESCPAGHFKLSY